MATIKANEDSGYKVKNNDLIPLVNNEGTVGKSVTPHQLIKAAGVFIVTDTLLPDHADPTQAGTIASALSNLSSTGGTIHLGGGTFEVTSAALVIPSNIRIIGAGKNTTVISQNHPTAHGFNVDSGVDFINTFFGIENLKITMPTSIDTGDAINLVKSRCSFGIIRSVIITGGNYTSWGITNNGNNQTNYEDIYINGLCNGARWLNTSGNINYGDCYVYGLEITLNASNTTGIYLSGTASAVTNNISFDRIEIKTNYFWTTGTGVHLTDYVNRCSFKQIDIENCANSLRIDDNCKDNTFINPQHIGSGNALINATRFGNNVFIGGNQPYRKYETYLPKGREIIIINSDSTLNYAEHSGKIINNTGAVSPVLYDLPTANNDHAFEFEIFISTAQPVTLGLTDASDIIVNTLGNQYTTWTSSGNQNEYIKIINCNYRTWLVVSQIGDWY